MERRVQPKQTNYLIWGQSELVMSGCITALFRWRIFTLTRCGETDGDLAEAQRYYFLVSRRRIKSPGPFLRASVFEPENYRPDHRDTSREEVGWCHDMAVMDGDVGFLVWLLSSLLRSHGKCFRHLFKRLHLNDSIGNSTGDRRNNTIKTSRSNSIWFKAHFKVW